MRIVVASGNIFRRELSSYLLSEAGYEVEEARTAEGLFGSLRTRPPALILLDQQLDGADPTGTLRAVRLLSAAPVVWIAAERSLTPVAPLDQLTAELVSWPFPGAELLATVAALLERADATRGKPPLRERYAGSAE